MSTKKLQIIGGTILQPDWNETDPTVANYIKNKPNISEFAQSGDFNDLVNKPVIDTSVNESSTNAVSGGAVYSQLLLKANVNDLSDVAKSGAYTDLSDKPDIGNKTTAGLTKLYDNMGDNGDGAMTQSAATYAIQNMQSKSKIYSITIPYASWSGSGPYTQILTVLNATANSKIDMQADATTIDTIIKGGYCIAIKNDNGVITAYAVGQRPVTNLTLQLIITEVIKSNQSDVIWGSPLIGAGVSSDSGGGESSSSSPGFIAQSTAPANTNVLWIDTGNSNLLKYYDGSKWTPISAAWG